MIKEITIVLILALVFAVIGAVAEYKYDLILNYLNP
tara:strand:- start:1153 stop:1260 length:108 start_codon:yes stop_codon:yes gene_type:complete